MRSGSGMTCVSLFLSKFYIRDFSLCIYRQNLLRTCQRESKSKSLAVAVIIFLLTVDPNNYGNEKILVHFYHILFKAMLESDTNVIYSAPILSQGEIFACDLNYEENLA